MIFTKENNINITHTILYKKKFDLSNPIYYKRLNIIYDFLIELFDIGSSNSIDNLLNNSLFNQYINELSSKDIIKNEDLKNKAKEICENSKKDYDNAVFFCNNTQCFPKCESNKLKINIKDYKTKFESINNYITKLIELFEFYRSS